MKAIDLKNEIVMEELRTTLVDDKDSFLVGVIASDKNRHWNILPIVACIQDEWYRIYKNEENLIAFGYNFTENGQQKFQQLTERFCYGEFFRIDRFQSHNRSLDGIPYFTFGNNTARLRNNFIDILEGELDFKQAFFKPYNSNDTLKYITDILNSGKQYQFYASTIVNGQYSLVGPFSINPNGISGNKLSIRAVISNTDSIWRFGQINDEMVFIQDCSLEDGTIFCRKTVWDWLPTNIGIEKKFLDDTRLIPWIIQKLTDFSPLPKSLNDSLSGISEILKQRKVDESELDLYDRALHLLDTIQEDSIKFENFLAAVPNTKIAREDLERIELSIQQKKQEYTENNNKLQELIQRINEGQAELEVIKSQRKMQEEQVKEYELSKMDSIKGELNDLIKAIEIKKKELNTLLGIEDLQTSLNKLNEKKNVLTYIPRVGITIFSIFFVPTYA